VSVPVVRASRERAATRLRPSCCTFPHENPSTDPKGRPTVVDAAAAPQLLRAGDSAGEGPGVGLIIEAKQRARRRRWIYGGAALVVAIAAVGAFSLPGSRTPPPPRAVPPTPLGAPEVWGPDAGSTLLASYAQIHDGFAYVYGDGRVIWRSDALWSPDEPIAYERRLSPRGLGLVWSGVLLAHDFKEGNPGPADVWTDPPDTPHTPWTPSEYAGCLYRESLDRNGFPSDATHRLGDLPATARALLHTRRTFPNANTGRATPGECFVLTRQEARAAAPRLSPQNLYTTVELIPGSAGEGAIRLWVLPVMPHGETFMWGG
jgi:hypothetical protein